MMIAAGLLGAMTPFAAPTIGAATRAQAESGLASYYGGHSHRGEMTCAHRSRSLGSIITVSHNGRSIQCRINDRGPFIRGRVIDFSVSAACALGMMQAGRRAGLATVMRTPLVAEEREADPTHGKQ